MSSIRAGQRIKASDLNAIIPATAYLPADASRVSTTAVTALGLAVPVDASTTYAVEAYLPYTADQAGDLKIALVAPAGVTGSWGLMGLVSTTTTAGGDVTAARLDSMTTADTLLVGGPGASPYASIALLRGYLSVGTTAGQLQVYAAQGTSSATATVIKAGAWLRLARMS